MIGKVYNGRVFVRVEFCWGRGIALNLENGLSGGGEGGNGYMKFSDRIGVTKIPDVLQTSDLSDALRNSLWNLLLRTIFNVSVSNHSSVTRFLAEHFFKIAVDTLPEHNVQQVKWLRSLYYDKKMSWWQIYNLFEFLANNCGQGKTCYWINPITFRIEANKVLESEMSAYRFVEGVLAPLSSEEEITSVKNAIREADTRSFAGTRQHLISAVGLMSQKPDPDYRNSIKESISALESLSKQITGESDGGLDKALSKLDKAVGFHAAFKAGILST